MIQVNGVRDETRHEEEKSVKTMSKTTRLVISILLALAIAIPVGVGGYSLIRWAIAEKNRPWFDEDRDEYVISTADELYEFAQLSTTHDFKGKTVKLGADIVVNEGNPADWEFEDPERLWDQTIDSFAGTFDGQGHSISGLCGKSYRYLYRTVNGVGDAIYVPATLFANTQAECVIKNVKILNSLFLSDLSAGVGSIASNGGGTFEGIYSNALVISYKPYNGGIIGQLDAKGAHQVTNCWFDGEIRTRGVVGEYTGGIVGRVLTTGSDITISHCLNTANITTEAFKTNVGGILGSAAPSARTYIVDCLNVGTITSEYDNTVGSVVGSVNGSSITITDTYTCAEGYKKTTGLVIKPGALHGAGIPVSQKSLIGFGGYQWTTLDFENYWAVVEGKTPVLQFFADDVPDISGMERNISFDWYDKAKQEYLLADIKDLCGLCILAQSNDFSNKKIKLGSDITLNTGDAASWGESVPEIVWTPIGTENLPFAGVFDGQGHTISGLYLSTGARRSGLFGEVAATAKIENLKLTNSYLESTQMQLGSIVGFGAGAVRNVYSDAIVVSSNSSVGGIVGFVNANSAMTIEECWFNGTVTNIGSAKGTGGILGCNYGGTVQIKNCLNSGTLDTTADDKLLPRVGGIVGNAENENPNLTIINCLNVGEIRLHPNSLGGVMIGTFVKGTAKCVTSYGIGVPGEDCVIGYMQDASFTIDYISGGKLIENENRDGNNEQGRQSPSQKVPVMLLSSFDHSAYVGEAAKTRLLGFDFDTIWATVDGKTPVLSRFKEEAAHMELPEEESKEIVLSNAEEFLAFVEEAQAKTFAGKTVKLAADITLNSGNAASWAKNPPANQWTPIGRKKSPFAGTFDGQGHTISGVYLNATAQRQGLFSETADTAVIQNLKLTNSYFTSSENILGSIVGLGAGTVRNVYSDAIVESTAGYVGGLVGYVNKRTALTMSECWFNGTASCVNEAKKDHYGGLVGYTTECTVRISDCLFTGTVKSAKTNYLGGIVGTATKGTQVTITDTLSAGTVIGGDNSGLLVGIVQKASAVRLTTSYVLGNEAADRVVGYSYYREDGSKVAIDYIFKGKLYENESRDKNYKQIPVVIVDEDKASEHYWGEAAKTVFAGFDFNSVWTTVDGKIPVLKRFRGEANRLKQHEEGPTEIVLSNAADLLAFAQESQTKTFEGKVIKLAADITLNSGSAATWAENPPANQWTPIGSKAAPFAGTFDGQGHTISGVYLSAAAQRQGLFSETADTAVIQNFKLTNSYLASSENILGGIVGLGAGTIRNIYSDAIVESTLGYVGGMVGYVNNDASLTLEECWFNGSVERVNEIKKDHYGSMVGYATGCTVEIGNCLFTGTVKSNISNYTGGLVGTVTNGATLTVTSSLSAGTVTGGDNTGLLVGIVHKASAVRFTTSYAVGDEAADRIVGYSYYKDDGSTVTIDYIFNDTFYGNVSRDTNYKQIPIMILDGSKPSEQYWGAPAATTLAGFDFETVWATVDGKLPVLRRFLDDAAGLEEHEEIVTEPEEIEISTAAELLAFAQESQTKTFEGKTIKLTADIDLNPGWTASAAAPANEWTSIGKKGNAFAGTFDGQGHTISGVYLSATAQRQGLFGETAGTAVVENFKLTNSYLTTDQPIFGAIVGFGGGTLRSVYTDAVVESPTHYVGMVGYVGDAMTIEECWFAGTVTCTGASKDHYGGIVGFASGTVNISDCLFTGTVTNSGRNRTGGFVGTASGATLTITDSLSAGTVVGGANSGLLVGCGTDGKPSTVHFVTAYALGDESASRVVGYKYSADAVNVDYVFNGVPGYSERNNSNYYNIPIMIVDESKASEQYRGDAAATTLAGFDFENTWAAVPGGVPILRRFDLFSQAAGTAEDPYQLSTAAELMEFARRSQTDSFAEKTVVLAADIDLNPGWDATTGSEPATVWTSIGKKGNAFAGTFDGQGYTISGVYLNAAEQRQGLFGETASTAVVKDFRLTNSYLKITDNNQFGAIVGYGGGTLQGIYTDAAIESNSTYVGGVVGISKTGLTVRECWFDGTVTCTEAVGKNHYGGILGYAAGTVEISDCLFTGTVTNGSHNATGGIAGTASGATLTITDSLSAGTVTGGSNSGLLVGIHQNSGTLRLTTSYVLGGENAVNVVGYRDGTSHIIIDYIFNETLYENVARDSGYKQIPIMIVDESKENEQYKGDAAATTLAGFDFENTWSTVPGGAPVLRRFQTGEAES